MSGDHYETTSRHHDLLRAYRARSLAERLPRGLTATAVTICADACSAATFLASLEPTLMLQLPRARDLEHATAIASALREAVTDGPIRRLFICGHFACAVSLGCGEDPVEAARQSLLVQCSSVVEDATLGPLVRSGRVSVCPLLFDEDAGDVFGIDATTKSLVLMSDRQVLGAFGL